GFHFKVRPLDEGEEPPTFFTALDGSTAATRVMKPGDKAPPPTPPSAAASDTAAEPEVEHVKTEVVRKEPEVKTTTPPTTPKVSTKPPTPPVTTTSTTPTSTRPVTSRPAATTSAPISQDILSDMLKELEQEEPPEGYQRELLIVYNEIYTVAEHKISVFGQEKVERKFEKVKDPPEGTFMAEGFIPRVIVKDGRVLGIELLKGTPDAILSPIKAEMKERLGDLISFFRSEVEEDEIKEGKKKQDAKRKLVAK
ncbi:MAG: hypothetical protein ACFFDR_05370, partial [Candidatus Thorarchaeota archaeon]